MKSPWPRVKPLSVRPLRVAPSGKIASPAPVTLAASSCAIAGADTLALANPRTTANTNPSRVIVSPSGPLFVDLDVPARERATLSDSRRAVRDDELVRALAGLRMVLDVRLEASRGAVRAAGARELRRRAGECRHRGDGAIEVRAREMVQVIEMATPYPTALLRVEAEATNPTGHVDLAAASHLPRRGR